MAASAPVPAVRDVPVLSRVQRAQHVALGVLWLVVLVSFWTWWLAPARRGALGLYLPATVAMAYLTTVWHPSAEHAATRGLAPDQRERFRHGRLPSRDG
jgi:hypothetical protein